MIVDLHFNRADRDPVIFDLARVQAWCRDICRRCGPNGRCFGFGWSWQVNRNFLLLNLRTLWLEKDRTWSLNALTLFISALRDPSARLDRNDGKRNRCLGLDLVSDPCAL